jgi:hypothetical protein
VFWHRTERTAWPKKRFHRPRSRRGVESTANNNARPTLRQIQLANVAAFEGFRERADALH